MSKIKFEEELNKSWQELAAYIDALETKIVHLEDELSILKTSPIFEPTIHQFKRARPIGKEARLLILRAHENLYKNGLADAIPTLTDFYAYVNAEIAPTASKTEIEGVIYNRFDERLYV